MSTLELKDAIFYRLNRLDDAALLAKVLELLEAASEESEWGATFEDAMSPQDASRLLRSIERSKDSENRVSHEEAVKMLRSTP